MADNALEPAQDKTCQVFVTDGIVIASPFVGAVLMDLIHCSIHAPANSASLIKTWLASGIPTVSGVLFLGLYREDE